MNTWNTSFPSDFYESWQIESWLKRQNIYRPMLYVLFILWYKVETLL